MKLLFHRYSIVVFMLPVLLTLSAVSATAIENINLQLKWSHAFQFAGYYAAKEKGYYHDAGLEVTILEARPGIDPVKVVLDGGADFGVGTSSLLLQRSRGNPVVVLAAIFQHSPYMLITRQFGVSKGIHDLAGKRVMLEPQAEELLAFLKKEGISLESITLQQHSFDPHDLILDKTDAISAYSINQPYYLDKAGFFYRTFTPRAAGIDFYGDNLFTAERVIQAAPGKVEAFRTASLRGWKYAMEHPEEIADLIVAKYSQEHSRNYYLFQFQQMLPLIQPDLVEIGYMNPGRWRHIADTYAELGLVPHEASLDGFLYDPQPLLNKLKQLYEYLGGTIVVMIFTIVIAIYIYRTNRQLARSMDKNLQATAALKESEQRWRTIIKTSPDGIAITAMDGTVLKVSDKIIAMLGHESSADILGRNLYEFIDPEYQAKAASRIGEMLNGTYTGEAEYLMICKTGDRLHVEANAEVLVDCSGSPSELFFIIRDITKRKQIENNLRSLSVAVEQSPLSVVITDLSGTIQYVNPRFTSVTGYTAEEVIGKNPRILHSGQTEQTVFEELWLELRQGNTWTGEFINRRKDGNCFYEEAHIAPVFDETGTITQYVAVKLDITERKRTEEQITHLAQHDTLTDLPNRALFSDRLQHSLARAQRDGACLALMFIDLDRFKPVNDTYGHAVGDLLLQEVAQRMQGCLRASDTVGRIGGDEFVVLLPAVDGEAEALQVAEKLRSVLSDPFTQAGHTLNISASIGIALYPDHAGNERELSQCADTAMYLAKQSGRNTAIVFREAMLEMSKYQIPQRSQVKAKY